MEFTDAKQGPTWTFEHHDGKLWLHYLQFENEPSLLTRLGAIWREDTHYVGGPQEVMMELITLPSLTGLDEYGRAVHPDTMEEAEEAMKRILPQLSVR